MAFTFDEISINTIIGSGSFISGDVKINGFIRVDGDVDGKIETQSNIIVGEKARIRGNISASSIIVGGIVIGDILAPKGIKLLSNSTVLGDIATNNLQIEKDVLFNGHCIALKDEQEFSQSSKNYSEQKEIQSKVI